jgi:geranylgeranyl pyrophosphate synthase
MDFTIKLNQLISEVETSLGQLVPVHRGTEAGPGRIHDAMRYSLQAGGKRLRPILVLSTAALFRPNLSALPAAVAVECVHTYSLVHDDLPCMDNDDLRRGRPTAHKQFDEATALLAGDALLTHAFLIIATRYAADPALAAALVRELADAAGSARLVGGQMQDLLAEKKADATAAELEFIHLNKTAAVLEASLIMGGLVGGADDALGLVVVRRFREELRLDREGRVARRRILE